MLTIREFLTSKVVALSVSAVCALGMVAPQAASAADTTVKCASPEIQTNSGQDGSTPRLTIFCSGGSSAGSIVAFAVALSAPNNLAVIVERIVDGWTLLHGATSTITLTSNFAINGASIGCGFGNCRLLDYVTGG